jgi:ammonium transporter Rh
VPFPTVTQVLMFSCNYQFGAYFGLAVSRVLGEPKGRCRANADPSVVSDVLCLIGTTLLWVYWPSFVGATETGNPATEHLCIIHTVLALFGSTVATFCFSSRWTEGGRFDPVHIANATLAGGVAVGASARLQLTPGGALLLGVLAGVLSTFGYAYVTPFCEDYLKTYDTCGVHNLHGLPSVLGGLASAIFVAIDNDAAFLYNDGIPQPARQILAVVTTLVLALVSGFLTGAVMRFGTFEEASSMEDYNDAMWWESCYMDALPQDVLDQSTKSKASISPMMTVEEAVA